MARINLLPWREERRNQRQRQFVYQLIGVIAVGVAVVFGLHVYVSKQIEAQNNRNAFLRDVIRDLDRDIQTIQTLQEERERLIARMEVIQTLQADRPLIVHVMEELIRTVPEGIQLESVTVRNENEMNIQGYADAQARVAEYLRLINGAEHLGDAFIIGSGILAREPGQQAPSGRYAFTIRAAIKPLKADDNREG
ncbi:MAG TPA: pilus assembly protein PilN [Halothiobacillus sp.]|nr:pilus assembly protein PilN [Halothiobacillus sp.]